MISQDVCALACSAHKYVGKGRQPHMHIIMQHRPWKGVSKQSSLAPFNIIMHMYSDVNHSFTILFTYRKSRILDLTP